MLSLFQTKLLSALMILLLTLAAGLYPFYKRYHSHRGHAFPLAEGFACGVFLGAGLIHMLGDAAQQFTIAGNPYPWACLIAGITFLLLYCLEELGRFYQRHQTSEQTFFALLATLMLSIHSLLEGAALGLSANLLIAVFIFIAIIAHKWAAGFALAININKTPLSLRSRGGLFFIFAVMTPAGIFLGNWIHLDAFNHPLLMPIFTAMAAGTFIYLGTVHSLGHRCHTTTPHLLPYACSVILGFAIMAIVAIWT
jgi:zinc transporter 1/2/3